MKVSAKRYGKGFTLVELLVVIAIIVALAAIAAPMAFKQLKKAAMTTALSNGKQIGQALVDFDQDFGRFPDEGTAQTLNNQQITGNFNGTANAFFRQLIAAGILDTEAVFYAKDGRARKPDDNIQADGAIANGECAFSYVMRQNAGNSGSNIGNGLSTASNSQLPVIMTPMETNGNAQFLSDPFDNRAVVIRLNNSGETPRITPQGTVLNLWPTNRNGLNLSQTHQVVHPQF